MRLFHQAGHNTIWNLDSFNKDKAGDGLIFSPVNLGYEKLMNPRLDGIRAHSLFDPQFYGIPHNHKNFNSYSFHPSNFLTNNSSNTMMEAWDEIISGCVEFQVMANFNSLIVPARYYEQIPSEYYNDLRYSYIEKFVNFVHEMNSDKDIYITLIVKEIEITDNLKREQLLNWITSIPGIDGVYLIFENNSNNKQIKSSDFLFNALVFLHYLASNQLKVIIGYTNLEGLLYSVAFPEGICMGTYENLRSFHGSKRFIYAPGNEQQGPRARLYSGKLLQYIDHGYLGSFQRAYRELTEIFEDSEYKPIMFTPTFKWHFTKPELYKHFFKIYSDQISSLPESFNSRFERVSSLIHSAIEKFEEIRTQKGILLNTENDGSHLYFWITALNQFHQFINEAHD